MLWDKRTQKAIRVAFTVVSVLLIAGLVVAYMPGIFY